MRRRRPFPTTGTPGRFRSQSTPSLTEVEGGSGERTGRGVQGLDSATIWLRRL